MEKKIKAEEKLVSNTFKLPVLIYHQIVLGDAELLAVREIEAGKYLVVVYRELNNDGFIITAFVTRRAKSLHRRKQLWPK